MRGLQKEKVQRLAVTLSPAQYLDRRQESDLIFILLKLAQLSLKIQVQDFAFKIREFALKIQSFHMKPILMILFNRDLICKIGEKTAVHCDAVNTDEHAADTDQLIFLR